MSSWHKISQYTHWKFPVLDDDTYTEELKRNAYRTMIYSVILQFLVNISRKGRHFFLHFVETSVQACTYPLIAKCFRSSVSSLGGALDIWHRWLSLLHSHSFFWFFSSSSSFISWKLLILQVVFSLITWHVSRFGLHTLSPIWLTATLLLPIMHSWLGFKSPPLSSWHSKSLPLTRTTWLIFYWTYLALWKF